MPTITIRIDPSTCILAATCVGMEPKLFQIRDESHVELIDDSGASRGLEYTFDASASEIQIIQDAVDSCATLAISMRTGS